MALRGFFGPCVAVGSFPVWLVLAGPLLTPCVGALVSAPLRAGRELGARGSVRFFVFRQLVLNIDLPIFPVTQDRGSDTHR